MREEEIFVGVFGEEAPPEPYVKIVVTYCQGEAKQHREELTVDLQKKTVSVRIWDAREGNSEYRHEIPGESRLFSIGLETDQWFCSRIGLPEDVLPDPRGDCTYEILCVGRDGGKTLRGSFDSEDLPEDYSDFAEAVWEATRLYQLPKLLMPGQIAYRRPQASDYIYCEVSFEDGYRSYHYRTEDPTIEEDTYVIVPAGKENREAIALVEQVEYYREEDVPWPLEETKFIIRKATRYDLQLWQEKENQH